ncbi:MAG: trypsin-like peptidase domain-containing protein [Planctomycetia bacterium]|nr:trypsin-like peptidase domain-containing protein [Planctomycetia bacterium]
MRRRFSFLLPALLAISVVALPVVARGSGLRTLDFRKVVTEAKAKVFPAVVYIKCIRESHESGRKISTEVAGSGVIINKEGEVLTNWHIVDKAVEVRCLLYDGRAMEAEVLGSDKDTDLALLKLKIPEGAKAVPYAEIGDSLVLNEGDFVMAMGAPWGLNRSVSIGIVSCTRRFLPKQSEYSLWIQTDAAISPGNSGGPLVNTAGEVVGINTRGILVGGGMGFAIPSETIKRVMSQIRKHGEVQWSWTGLQLQPLRDFNRNIYFEAKTGVIVAGTDPESPARRAGILVRDRIIKINGDAITAVTEEDLPAVRTRLGLLAKFKVAKVELVRAGKTLTLDLTPRDKGKVEGEELDCPRWDLTVKTINQFDNRSLYFYRKKGVFIFGVKYPGNAGQAGLGTKDIIVKIDGKEVVTLEDVKKIHKATLEKIKTKHRIVFTVLRGGLMRQIVLDFERDYEKE